jgi:hypothetical protein
MQNPPPRQIQRRDQPGEADYVQGVSIYVHPLNSQSFDPSNDVRGWVAGYTAWCRGTMVPVRGAGQIRPLANQLGDLPLLLSGQFRALRALKDHGVTITPKA